jgi:hypothetical protein
MGKAQRGFVSWPWGWVRVQVIALGLAIGALVIAPTWRTAVAIGLMLAAFGVELGVRSRQVGPYGGLVAGVVVTHELFLEDLKGRTRAWLGVENQYGDEEGPRLVLYDEKGQARLALRLVREKIEQSFYKKDKHAEVVPSQVEDDEPESKEPALVMFDKDGKINLSLWSKQEYPALTVDSARGYGVMQPGGVSVMARDGEPSLELYGGGKVIWRAP